MLFGKYIAGLVILSVLPLLFLLARFCAKRSRLLPWTIDDTFLLLALVLPSLVAKASAMSDHMHQLLQYVVMTMFIVSMAASLAHQHIVTATMADLKRTLIILWLFRLPMAISIALTRCAILVFFVRTLFTKTYSWLRHGGIVDPRTTRHFRYTRVY
ncbi:hypothetical protein B0T12DRAFT_255707 [Alternaria alternata]|nr:hypothetical protein B0T12DRAFT_255707 [Alternaria alternata]